VSGAGQPGVAGIGRDRRGSPRTAGHGRNNLRRIGASGLSVESAAQAGVQRAQGRCSEHPRRCLAAAGAGRGSRGLRHRTHEIETAATATPVAVRGQHEPPSVDAGPIQEFWTHSRITVRRSHVVNADPDPGFPPLGISALAAVGGTHLVSPFGGSVIVGRAIGPHSHGSSVPSRCRG
jgi:hypothetical protein